jgi:2,3-bisphosphoglycerate-independent phosphoglycerate mutase
VHCTEKLIFAYVKAANDAGIKKIYVHPILDGRDVAPQSAALYLERLDTFLKTIPHARIGSLHGRFYAMDRDNNWDRTEQSYEVLTSAHGSMILARKARRLLTTNGLDNSSPLAIPIHHTIGDEGSSEQSPEYQRVTPLTWQHILSENYAAGITDEFIPPINLNPDAVIKSGDGIIFANYRPDRARQLTECFTKKEFTQFKRKNLSLDCFITPVAYGSNLQTNAMYPEAPISHTFKEILSRAGKTIFSIAETEKFAHVTYFFDGGKETVFPGETRVLIPSIHARNYISNPQMSAQEITSAIIKSLRENPHDFYLINYANADMVGHSGNFEATKKAIEVLDAQLAQLYAVAVQEMHGTMFITADHGKAENMFDEKTNEPCTAHTTNPVPFLMIDESKKNGAETLPLDQLADIMPFILNFMGIKS